MVPSRRPSSVRLAAAASAVALLLAACGGDEPVEDAPSAAEDAPADDAAADAGDDAADGDDEAGDEGPRFGSVVAGDVRISAAEGSPFTPDPDTVAVIAAGGCSGDQFGLQLQINDDTPRTVAQVLVELDEDLSGGVTGTFPLEEFDVELIDYTDGFEQTRLRGPGELVVSEHEAPNELNERRMVVAVTGTALEASDGTTTDVDAEFTWIMGCP